jgi:hypothetical protein
MGAGGSSVKEAPPEKGEYVAQASLFAHIAASPRTYFSYAITLLAVLILALGGYAWWHEVHQHHLRHSFYAVALSLALISFLYAADATMFADPAIADSVVVSQVT